jgi:sugar phosphate isomerase/epimerase
LKIDGSFLSRNQGASPAVHPAVSHSLQQGSKMTFARRTLLQASSAAALGLLSSPAWAAPKANRKFTIDLCPGRLGVSVNQVEAIRLAKQFGFESVEPLGWDLVKKSKAELEETMGLLNSEGLVWGAGGLPVEFRQDAAKFEADMKKLPAICSAYEACGVTRIGTWLMPTHAERTYRANFEIHSQRLRAAAKVLSNHGLRLGLEYVGPKTLWTSKRHSFVHTLAETKELLAAIGTGNVGVVLDSWHWYTAKETVADLKTLTNNDIVAVDLNDAPAGIPIDEQIDNTRALPAATGVIDLKTFLTTLVELDYDGPVRAEPFDKQLNAMDNVPAVKKTGMAMQKAFDLIGG